MKTLIKIDGTSEEFNPTKIVMSVERANNDVREEDRIDKTSLQDLTNAFVQSKKRKRRILAEDVRASITERLISAGKPELAKAYSQGTIN